MKYIIELKDDVQVVQKVGVTENGNAFVMNFYKDQLEELTADYINEHYGSLQDEAYKRGINDGSLDVKQRVEGAYQRGLNDAWECARELYLNGACKDLFGEYFNTFIKNHTAQEAIAKLKAYEEKQNDKIEVGDEVLWFMKGDDEGCDDIMDVCAPSVVTMVPNKECDDYTIIESSGAMTVISKEQIYKKTGRHFDIASILEDMRK